MKRIFFTGFVICVAVFIVIIMDSIQRDVYSKSATSNEIKAAFLIKFTDFIKWPDTAFESNPDSFVLGILGMNIFHHLLDPFIGKSIQGRKFMIRHYKGMAEVSSISNVQILFVSHSEVPHYQEIFNQLNTHGILTISDRPEFIRHGGTIAFVKRGNRIGFEINRVSEKRAGLKISSDLLQLATRVYTK